MNLQTFFLSFLTSFHRNWNEKPLRTEKQPRTAMLLRTWRWWNNGSCYS